MQKPFYKITIMSDTKFVDRYSSTELLEIGQRFRLQKNINQKIVIAEYQITDCIIDQSELTLNCQSKLLNYQ